VDEGRFRMKAVFCSAVLLPGGGGGPSSASEWTNVTVNRRPQSQGVMSYVLVTPYSIGYVGLDSSACDVIGPSCMVWVDVESRIWCGLTNSLLIIIAYFLAHRPAVLSSQQGSPCRIPLGHTHMAGWSRGTR